MTRPIITSCLILFLGVSLALTALAVTIPEDDFDSVTGPCSLAISDVAGGRLLSWEAVSGCDVYVVGYRTCNGDIVGLAEMVGTSYQHAGFDPSACLEYVVIAYDGSRMKICSAHAVTANCPCR